MVYVHARETSLGILACDPHSGLDIDLVIGVGEVIDVPDPRIVLSAWLCRVNVTIINGHICVRHAVYVSSLQQVRSALENDRPVGCHDPDPAIAALSHL